jgi:hypothetical protein
MTLREHCLGLYEGNTAGRAQCGETRLHDSHPMDQVPSEFLTPEEALRQESGEVRFVPIRRRPLGERPLLPGDPDYPKADVPTPWGIRRNLETTIEDQPPPVPNDDVASWDLVIADMRERDQVGRERYGTPLQPGNGRDSLVDAYQESLDQVVYLRNRIEEEARARMTDDERLEMVALVWHDARWGVGVAHNGGSAPFKEPVVACDWCKLKAAENLRAIEAWGLEIRRKI